jgi:hypothetical protein
MSTGLPVVATWRMIGHVWTPRPLDSGAMRALEVCARCDAENEPRHLRQRP